MTNEWKLLRYRDLVIVVFTLLGVMGWMQYEKGVVGLRAIHQLENDGYRNLQIISYNCVVARAIDFDGNNVEAYACQN